MTKTIIILLGILLSLLSSAQNTSIHFVFPKSNNQSAQLISFNLKELYSRQHAEWPWHITISAKEGKATSQLTLPEPLLMSKERNGFVRYVGCLVRTLSGAS